MSRFFLVLTTVMMMSAAFAGCFGEDGDSDDNGNGTTPPGNNNGDNNTTSNPNNNTTSEPKVVIAPTPAFTVSMATFDSDGNSLDNVTGTNFTATPGLNATFTFDGSASTDEDGTIEAYSWQVITPEGTEFKNSGPALTFTISLKGSSFGVFKATLKVLDSDNVLNSAEFFVVLNYQNTFELPTGMTGPGQASCDGEQAETKAGSDLAGTGVAPGTYAIHKLTVGSNASALDLNLDYSGGTATELTMRVLPPESAEDACGDAIGEAGGGSPIALSVTDLAAEGQYIIRVDLDGVQVASYTIDVTVTYQPPLQSTDSPEPPAEEE